MADHLQRQQFTGTIVLNGNTYTVRGTFETLPDGIWYGSFEKPNSVAHVEPLCHLTINGITKAVFVGRVIRTATVDLVSFWSER